MLSIIVAKSKNNIIGKDNKLIWNIKDDLKRFKDLTTCHIIIMGAKTFKSLGRVLPNRTHIVLTHNKEFTVDNPNVIIIHDLKEIDKYINSSEECFVIGGGMVYKELMDKCQKMYITEIEKDFEGDTYFPEIDLTKWKIIKKIEGPKDNNNFDYKYIDYEKII